MKKTSVADIYNAQVAEKLRELLKCSPVTQKKTTNKTLAEYLGVKQQSVSSWANGTTIPDTKHIVPIAIYFGVSCDYLLGRTRAAAPDDLIEAILERYGFEEAALTAVSDAHKSDEQAKIIARRDVINLLLSNEHGKKALERLALYFFGQLDKRTQSHGVQFEQLVNLGNAKAYINNEFVEDNEVYETLLRLSDKYFQKLRETLRDKED